MPADPEQQSFISQMLGALGLGGTSLGAYIIRRSHLTEKDVSKMAVDQALTKQKLEDHIESCDRQFNVTQAQVKDVGTDVKDIKKFLWEYQTKNGRRDV